MEKENKNKWAIAAKCTGIADRVLNVFIAIVIIITLLYGAFGLWDAYRIYKGAQTDSELLKYKPDINSNGNNPTLAELQKINPDVCAWLSIDNTNIDYPVVQGKDNLDYINKDVYGEYSLSGSVFLDTRNKRDFTDFYSLLYAHHMSGEAMFGLLPRYEETGYFDTHRTGYLFTPTTTYKLQVFAYIKTDAFDKVLFDPSNYSSEASKKSLIKYIASKSSRYINGVISPKDKILSLSTCYSVTTNGRAFVLCKMIEGYK